jgi:two-component system sensor histidine kinase SenX3
MESLDTELVTGLRQKLGFFSARAVAMGDGNVLLVIEDRTEAKRLDDTRRDFIANISHELKTPIGAISLLSETIAGASDDPAAVAKFTKSLSREAKRLSNLVKDIIQLSRFQSVELVGKADLVDLSTVVSDAVERNQVRAESRNININFDAPEGVEVFGDAEMLTVAIKNLIENAVNYSDEGSTVGVGIRESHGVAAISVTDAGIGLNEEDQNRVFERFYRVDPSRSRDTGGTGLGLAIVKHVAISHQGEIRVFSKPGVGSTFTLRLPLADTKIVVSDTERTNG